MGRPTKYNDTRCAAIVRRLRDGSTRKAAAEAGRVSYDTFCAWLKRGAEEPEGPYGEFAAAVQQVEAAVEAEMAAVLRETGQGYDASETVRTTKTEEHPDGKVTTVTTETTVIKRIRDWRASESWLKRRRRDEWGDNSANTHAAPGGGPILIREVVVEMTPDDPDQAEGAAAEPLAD